MTEKDIREGSKARGKLKKRIEERRHREVREGKSPAMLSHASLPLQDLSPSTWKALLLSPPG